MFEIVFVSLASFISAFLVFSRVDKMRHNGKKFPCTTFQFGLFAFLLCSVISVVGLILYHALNTHYNADITDAIFYCGLITFSVFITYMFVPIHSNIRLANEMVFRVIMFISASFAFFITVGIVLSLAAETLHFFTKYPLLDFMFGLEWSPQIALREDQAGASGKFGSLPLLMGTLLITAIALSVAFPVGVGAAVYMSEFALPKTRRRVKPMLEILAGVPTVVYGFFAAVTVAPMIKVFGESYGFEVSSESALAAGLVMGVMIVPYICSLSDDVLHAVPQSLRDGSHAMGATAVETIMRVTLPAAFPGIVSAFVLGFSRAIGETMIVLMAAGLAGNLTLNPLDSVTTFTVQIGTLLTGDQEFDSVKTLSAFALGSALFITTLILNLFAVRIIRKYREKYV